MEGGYFNTERLFLSFIALNTNRKQLVACLSTVDRNQYLALREIALNIVSGVIPLDDRTHNKLYRHRNVIRKLSAGKLTRKLLKESGKVIVECVRLALLHHEAGRQVHSRPGAGVAEVEEDEGFGDDGGLADPQPTFEDGGPSSDRSRGETSPSSPAN